jgi:hypothetical protein
MVRPRSSSLGEREDSTSRPPCKGARCARTAPPATLLAQGENPLVTGRRLTQFRGATILALSDPPTSRLRKHR